MDRPTPHPHRLQYSLVFLCALLLLAETTRCADVDALVRAFANEFENLTYGTPDTRWLGETGKGHIAEFYGIPWPLPETRMTREQLEQKVAELERSVPEVPDDARLAALLDEKFPLLKVGDSIEFTATKAGKEQLVKGKVTSIRMARELAGGGKLDAAVGIDEDVVWKKDELPVQIRASLFADEHAKWVAETVPALQTRLQAKRQEAIRQIPEKRRMLTDRSGLIPPPEPWAQLDGSLPSLLTAAEVELVLNALSAYAQTAVPEIYRKRRIHEEERRAELDKVDAAMVEARRNNEELAKAETDYRSWEQQHRQQEAQVQKGLFVDLLGCAEKTLAEVINRGSLGGGTTVLEAKEEGDARALKCSGNPFFGGATTTIYSLWKGRLFFAEVSFGREDAQTVFHALVRQFGAQDSTTGSSSGEMKVDLEEGEVAIRIFYTPDDGASPTRLCAVHKGIAAEVGR